MKITKVNITAFGKLKNVALHFTDGVNVLQQSNGFGKSTLCAFVRAMLYGLSYTYKTVDGVRANDVTKYMPWDSNRKFGGSMEISHDGKNYRIERFFGSTARSESLQVVDLSTGNQLDIANVGEYFLGLTVESYDRCTYLPQEQVNLASNQNFDAKLANLVQDSAEDYDKLQEKLRAYKKNLKYERGFGGEIPTLEGEIVQLQSKLVSAENDAKERKLMSEQLTQIDQQLQQTEKEIAQLSHTIEHLQQALYQAKPSQADVELAQKIEDVELKLATVPQTLTEDYNKFNQLFAQKNALQKKHKPQPLNNLLLIISSILLLFFLSLMVIMEMYFLAGVIAVTSILAVIILFPKSKTKNAKQRVNQLEIELFEIVSKYINPNGKSLLELKDEFWNYHNDYQTNLSIRNALGEKPIIKSDEGNISTQLQQAKVRLQALTERKQTLTKTQHQLQFALSQPTISTVEIADELFAKQQQLQVAKHKYLVATKTVDILAQAKESLSSAYIPELCTRTERLLNNVTTGNYKVLTDRNFAISLQENGQTKPLCAFSRGIKEITLLCFRIALAELIYGKDIPLLIVDDAFVNFDEQNFQRATMLLKQLSSKTQVIYFTCHNRTGNL